MKNVAFYLGLSALLTHELDAIPNHEWRVLPFLKTLPDETAMFVFVAAHVPLFAIISALVASTNATIRSRSWNALAGFLVIHGVAHAYYVGHAHYEFTSPLSSALIFGGAACGAVYLFLERRDSAPMTG